MSADAFDAKAITLGDLIAGRVSFREYRENCSERHKDKECFREANGYSLCCGCPKKEKERVVRFWTDDFIIQREMARELSE